MCTTELALELSQRKSQKSQLDLNWARQFQLKIETRILIGIASRSATEIATGIHCEIATWVATGISSRIVTGITTSSFFHWSGNLNSD